VIASVTSASFTIQPSAPPRRFAVHGLAVEVECAVPEVSAEVGRALGAFEVGGWPDGFTPVGGVVRAYDSTTVARHVSPNARPLPRSQDLAELYEDGERFWLVDERWGMAEVNFLKGTWRSWVLPHPQCDPVRVAEMAVLWPLAQLLRPRGLYLLPAAAAVRDGFAFLLVCPFGVGPELTALARAGYKIIGQQWTAVREEDGRLALLHLPGRVERGAAPRLARWAAGGDVSNWVDLNAQFPGSTQHHAFCDAVLVAGAGRRAQAALTALDPSDALHLLRQAWPIVELHPHRRHSPLPLKLSQQCTCAEAQLSRNAAELVDLLEGLRCGALAPAHVA
jgi:hypothetical protein